MAEAHVIEFDVTDEMADAAATAILQSPAVSRATSDERSILIKSILYGAIGAGGIVVGLMMDMPWWWYLLPAMLLGMVLLVVVVSLLVSRQRSKAGTAIRDAFRRLESARVRWTFDPTGVTVQNGRATTTFPWSEVTEVSLAGSFWVLTVRGHAKRLLPANKISDEAARFALGRAREAGARIRVEEGAATGESAEGER